MEEQSASAIADTRRELVKFPALVLEEFDRVLVRMPDHLTEAQLATWATAGVEIAGQTVRSWEAAAQYYKVSDEVVGYMPFNYFVKWTRCGTSLCSESPTLATAYFEASPGTLSKLRSRHIESWAALGSSLYRGTWKSSTVASKFFSSTPSLVSTLTFTELEQFAAFLDALSHRSYDLASECLTLGEKLFPLIGKDKAAFISLASALVETGWREVKSFFEASARALPRIDGAERLRFLRLAERLVKGGGTNIPTSMLEMSQSLADVDREDHGRILELSESLIEVLPGAVPEFIKACPVAMERITIGQVDRWFEHGLALLRQNPEGGLAYFKIESSYSEQMLETLSSGVEFDRIKSVMEMYCCALAGAEIKLAASQELVSKNIGWVSSESASTEGSTVYVPSVVDRYSVKDENFSWFKVVSTHQVAHLEFGSFRFEFDFPSTLFEKNMRADAERRRPGRAAAGPDGAPVDGVGLEQAWITDMQRFFDLFKDRKLSLDIFTVVEDGRLDATVKQEYPGIRNAYVRVQTDSVKDRSNIRELPAREALVELLVRVSLQQDEPVPAPTQYRKEARRIASIAGRVMAPGATVEDVSEATLRIYAIIAAIPNEEVAPEDWEDMELDDGEEQFADSDEMEEILQRIAQGMEMELRPEDEQEYDSSENVEYRGDFKPELAQLMTQLRMQQQEGGESSAEPMTQEMLEEMLKNSAELEMQAVQADLQNTSGLFANNILKEAGINLPQNPEAGQGPLVHVAEEGGALDASEPETFVYDEWDFRADDYKPRWCIVRQKMMAEGDAAFYGTTLHNYRALVGQVRRQFELMVPETFRKVRKLEDGEEIDIDDVIEALIDIRAGVSPSDKFYWRRNKVQREVAVAFLLDTSASTAEAIDEGKRAPEDWDAPDDPVEYMVWLRTRRGDAMRRSYKRIIDVEKEAVVLLINALEAIGDIYGIYGFSGYGRENVEFFTIKDLDEIFSEKVKQRIDRIAPLHATRMGPAIRHASSKLDTAEARTKLLFLISDGRPQDRGYSREGVEKEYAVHDTRMALDEARRRDIKSFCLTVDKAGHDYLKTMCQDISYEVLDDVNALPERLLYLYKSLTM